MVNEPRRHLFIPDTQVRPKVRTDHLDWVGQAIVDYKPDVIVHGGDHWDFPSLNGHEESGSEAMEGARYQDDLDVGNEAFAQISKPAEAEIARTSRLKTPWKPELHFNDGNHEDRADRYAARDPKFSRVIGSHHCNVRGWQRHRFLTRVWIDGVCYSHFFQNSHSSHAIGGSIDNRLNKIGDSFVQGHEQGFRYGNRIMGSGKTRHGLVAGSCYTHIENYRGRQGQRHWRGIVILNEVRDGDYCVMPLTLDYLCRRYERTGLRNYMRKKYPREDWSHLE